LQAAEEHGVVIKGLKIGTAGADPVTTDQVMQDAVRQMMGDVADPHFQRTVEETLQEMASGAGNSGVGGVDAADPLSDGNIAASVFSSLATHSGAAGAQTIAQTMAMLSKLGEGINEPGGVKADGTLPGSDAAQSTESLSDELIRNMMGEYEAMGKKADFENITDNMMRQLLSKDIMCVCAFASPLFLLLPSILPLSFSPFLYQPDTLFVPYSFFSRYEPMRSITERFPSWLAVYAEKLSREEYENYGRMYMTFQKVVMTFETDPDNFPRILELFQDLQEAGNPPIEIIKSLAPALELTSEGMPAMMPNMGPGMAGGGENFQLPGAACSIQ